MQEKHLKNKEQLRKKLEGHGTLLKMTYMDAWCALNKVDERMAQFHNRHKGQRCFIVATGPSLTIEDVESLKGEVCFSMNSCIKMFDKTSWRPDYYLIFDPAVYAALYEDIRQADLNQIFYNSFSIPQLNREGIPVKVNSKDLTYEKSAYAKKKDRPIHFSENVESYIYEGHSTVYGAIELAAYMGFEEIYLIGCDCNYYTQQHSEVADYQYTVPQNTGDLMMRDYVVARREVEARGIKLYNATRGGKLEVLERIALENVLNTKKTEKAACK